MLESDASGILSALAPRLGRSAASRLGGRLRRRVCAVVLVSAACWLCSLAAASAECIDYGDYLHWVGSVATADYTRDVAVSGTCAYVADLYAGLEVIDITDPASPQVLGSVGTPGSGYGVAVSGTHAYVADYGSGLQAIDVTDPASPQIVGSVNTPGYAYGVVVSGRYAYVADESFGLQVIDISDPTSPQIVGSVNTPGYAYGVA
ncbi:MAG: hypothetical protein WAW06_04795, partial [bacterium]